MELDNINTIKSIFLKTFNTEPSLIEEIVGKGVVNRVFKCEVNKNFYILRLQDTPDAVGNYKKEEWVMNLALLNGVNTASPVAIGTEGRWYFSIQTFIEGLGAEEFDDQFFIWHELGKVAKKIHTIEIEGFGENPKFEKNPDGDKTWKDVVLWFEKRVFCDNLFLKFDILTQTDLEKIKEIIDLILKWDIKPVLCHGNLTPRNAIIKSNNQLFVYDWGTSCGFPKEREFAEFVAWDIPEEYQQAFFEGYGYTRGEYEKNKNQIYIFAIMRLIDAARWGIENKPDWKKESFVLHAINKTKELLSLI